MINLSKLVLSPYFFELLKEENINFEAIITDNKKLAKEGNIHLIDQELWFYFKEIEQKARKVLIILDILGIDDILPFLWNKFEQLIILDTKTWLASFGKKTTPKTKYINKKLTDQFSIFFPFDIKSFLNTLATTDKIYIPLTNKEISESLYQYIQDENFSIIDKENINNPGMLSFLSSKESDLLLIGFGNHLEELIKCSQLLQDHSKTIAIKIIENRDMLFSNTIKEAYKKTKKIWIIIDHEVDPEFLKLLENIDKPITIIGPKYHKLTSISSEYQDMQTWYDAIQLAERALKLANE